jgi:hypothetical protein
MLLDPDTRELLRVRPNPLGLEQARRLQGARPPARLLGRMQQRGFQTAPTDQTGP